jgi:protein O-mannosyl-transferase
MVHQIRVNRLLLFGLIGLTLVCFWPVGSLGFIHLDDYDYVCNNPVVRSGINGHSVFWSFTAACASNWHPVTWLSHMCDCELFELDAQAAHWENLGFHLANTALLFLWLWLVTRARWRSFFVAGLFALHPLHVESVAWIAERKDVLSGFFFLLVLLAYTHYARHKTTWNYLLVVALFLLGLMAKPMLVSVPIVLLLLDFWPLSRVNLPSASTWRPFLAAWRPLLLEKIPFALASLASCLMTVWAQSKGDAFGARAATTLAGRCLHALVAYNLYLGKVLWPVGLAIYYPLSHAAPPVSAVLGSLLLLALLLLAGIWLRRAQPWLLVGWAWFLVMLLPVIGIVQVGLQSVADRYAYLPTIGLFIVLVWGGAELAARSQIWRMAAICLGCVGLLACGIDSRHQLGFWRDDLSLYKHVVEVTPRNNYVGYLRLAKLYFILGQDDQGITALYSALEAEPKDLMARDRLALELLKRGDFAEAAKHYRLLLAQRPDLPVGLNNLARILAVATDPALRNGAEAVPLARRACELTHFKNPNFLSTLAAALAETGKFDEAASTAQNACDLAAASGNAQIVEQNRKMLDLFQHHQAYHLTVSESHERNSP